VGGGSVAAQGGAEFITFSDETGVAQMSELIKRLQTKREVVIEKCLEMWSQTAKAY